MEKSNSATSEKEIVEAETAIISQKVIKMIEEEGAYKVAKKMNVPQARFQHLKNGGGLSLSTMVGLSKAIRIDWNKMIYGNNNGNLVDAPDIIIPESEMKKELEELRKKLNDLKSVEEENISLKGELNAYEKMMGKFIRLRPLSDEEVEDKRKTSNFNQAPGEARVLALNFDENTEDYYPQYIEPGFKPRWMSKNASRA